MDSIEQRQYIRNQTGFLTPRECQIIHEEFLLHEDEVLAIPQGDSSKDAYSGLTRQHRVFNWLSNPRVSRLGIPTKIFQQEPFIGWKGCWIQCWGNILRQGENLPEHCHRGDEDRSWHTHPTTGEQIIETNTLYACNVFLSGHTDTGTTIRGTLHENEVGELTIFGENVLHKVTTNFHQEPRVSLAMDIYEEDFNYAEVREDSMQKQPFRYRWYDNPYFNQT